MPKGKIIEEYKLLNALFNQQPYVDAIVRMTPTN